MKLYDNKYPISDNAELRVSKKQAKDMQAAIDVVYKEYESKNTGWKWVQK